MKAPAGGAAAVAGSGSEGERRAINPDLWHACAGPLVSLPPVGSLVVYFPQGHSEQVAASMQKDIDGHIPNYPNLPSKLICLLHNVTLHADTETDEVYAQMTLQPVNTYEKAALQLSELALKQTRPQTEFFCKTLTASDTSTHGGFSVPRRAAEKIFPPLDFSLQPPAQELQARDLHENVWNFRHIYRGQPKRHLLTTGWSLFVSGKKLYAGNSVIFVRDQKQQLLLGIRRANRQSPNLSSSVLSSDSMHIGILAAAAHAAANNSPFTVFYNPRASPSEFVIPFAKYQKAACNNQISLGMRFRMMFETEELGTRRYMGTITGISDLDPVRWKNSQWRNLQVGWDESAAGERHSRVSIWEIEPVAAPFFICPPPFFRTKRPRQPGMADDESMEMENLFKRAMPWLGEEICIKDPHTQSTIMPGLSLVQWMSMQQNPSFSNAAMQPEYLRSLATIIPQNVGVTDPARQLGFQNQLQQQNNIHFSTSRLPKEGQTIDETKVSASLNQLGATVCRPEQQVHDICTQQWMQPVNQALPLNQTQTNLVQPPALLPNQQQQQPLIHNQKMSHNNLQQNQQQHQLVSSQQQPLQQQQHKLQQLQQQQKQQQQNNVIGLLSDQPNQQLRMPDQQIQLQILQQLLQQQQQHSLLTSTLPLPQLPLVQEQQKVLMDVQQLSNSHSLPQVPQRCNKASSQTVLLPQSSDQQTQQNFPLKQAILSESHQTALPQTSANITFTARSSFPGPAAAQTVLIDDIPSCSTSPSTKNVTVLPQSLLNKTQHYSTINTEKAAHLMITVNPNSLEAMVADSSQANELPKLNQMAKQCAPVLKVQSEGVVLGQNYPNATLPMEYLDTSSATSACLPHSDGLLQQGFPLSTSNQQYLIKDALPHIELQGTDPRNTVMFGFNGSGSLGANISTRAMPVTDVDLGKYENPISHNVVANYRNSKEPQQEPSSSMVSQSFDVSDVAFNSIDSTINESAFLRRNSWTPAPPLQRMRTYTKVYKRGAVGRSIDITRYSGYDELKNDLARMFSIEGQLADGQKIGWKLVYKDHEEDILLVGDDPWEEFVNCVHCIRILSPEEVQQMSLDGDLGNNVLPNPGCISSDGGNAWTRRCDQNNVNPFASSYDCLE